MKMFNFQTNTRSKYYADDDINYTDCWPWLIKQFKNYQIKWYEFFNIECLICPSNNNPDKINDADWN